ncbi:A/G-specific adenine glycosylase [Enterococcus pallens]|uniref:Adenine DNA glycosylase n=1 Tax=Enterococcus pallens ATCC BAA-351 TaxID=1158607 RepID=R2RWS6_9ENTE|nr:A/G-specific adenine glycosylase [Enterococcus pallens]EOH87765.1 A/G-specific adenine glycosylase [Enterococcus pallens ATCC BAA-351]EOU17979.1 A/G-specific adenine glycosylase [Enterococcus pallens ATCC BAA-351]
MNKKLWEAWSPEKVQQFQMDFLDWYQKEKRNLPWRYNQDPYRVWISEIMLQQTRVDTVIDYYYRFMEAFPTIADLAKAPEDKLLKIWEGLGYYSRARNLQAAAKQILDEFGGQFPDTIDDIRSLKGIGPYTAGAIGSISFKLSEPAIDGNVMRVVSRLFCIEADIAKANSRKVFDEAMRKIISHEEPGDFNQAMMDLGSSICTPKAPKCEVCPIQAFCLAFKEQRQTEFPVKSKKLKPKDVYYVAGVIENNQQEFLLQQRPESGLLASMWLFPLEEISMEKFTELKSSYTEELNLFSSELVAEDSPIIFSNDPVVWQKKILGEVTHVFSHLRWHILVFYGRTNDTLTDRGTWVKRADFDSFVFPKPQQKMLEVWEKN